MIKKRVTIEDLARITQKGFEGVDKKFEGVDKKFEEINERFDTLEYEMNKRFDQLEKIIFSEYKNRIERLEDQVEELQSDFRQLIGTKK